MEITRVNVIFPLRANDDDPSALVSLCPTTANVTHVDPLAKVLTKPCSSFTAVEFLSPTTTTTTAESTSAPATAAAAPRRYEADSQSCRGGSGMTDQLRASSIASASGEAKVSFFCPKERHGSDEQVMDLWRKDLEQSGLSSNAMGSEKECNKHERGSLEVGLRRRAWQRDERRRRERVELVAKRLTATTKVGDSNSKKGKGGTTSDMGSAEMGFKLVIQFRMRKVSSGSVHLGGIHFESPVKGVPSTPHVYTTCGTMGDHQGPRSWVPTIDSSSSKHRSSHCLTISVTAKKEEGLWAAGCGENFGVSGVILHPGPSLWSDKLNTMNSSADQKNSLQRAASSTHVVEVEGKDSQDNFRKSELMKTLGKSSLDFIAQSFASTTASRESATLSSIRTNSKNNGSEVHIIPPSHFTPETYLDGNTLSTATFISCIWSPCPSRSLGFAVGPFKVLYDKEYYGRAEIDEDEDDEDGVEHRNEDDEEEENPTLEETAFKLGEGVRQLYFSPFDERSSIHALAPFVGLSKDSKPPPPTPKPTCPASVQQLKREIIISLIGSTTGVSNRALSLMRDILSLPSYRTSSYTQIWIPNAVDGGSTCGNLHACPEISCNPILGGAILDAKLLPPPGRRLPHYEGGRVLQFLQAQCVIRGWITSSLPLAGSDEIGQGYLHVLLEVFLVGLYERAHGATGEGGSRQSFFFSKRYSIGSGLNSPNMEFLPVTNIENEDVEFAGVGVLGAIPVGET